MHYPIVWTDEMEMAKSKLALQVRRGKERKGRGRHSHVFLGEMGGQEKCCRNEMESSRQL
jgi:hypothetical protein